MESGEHRKGEHYVNLYRSPWLKIFLLWQLASVLDTSTEVMGLSAHGM